MVKIISISSVSLVLRSALLRASRRTATREIVPAAILRGGRAKCAASSEREKESNLGWRGRMTFRHRSPGGNFDSRLPHFGVEYSTFWGPCDALGRFFHTLLRMRVFISLHTLCGVSAVAATFWRRARG